MSRLNVPPTPRVIQGAGGPRRQMPFDLGERLVIVLKRPQFCCGFQRMVGGVKKLKNYIIAFLADFFKGISNQCFYPLPRS